MKYSEIYTYWNRNPCAGGNPDFPFEVCKNKKVLEIGCGMGEDAIRFCQVVTHYTGIDLTEKAINITRQRIMKLPNAFINLQSFRVEKMNAEFLDFPDETFDLVYSWGVIHHAITPQNIVNEAYRVLKRDGIFFIMLYNKSSFRYNIEILFLRKILWYLHYPKYTLLRKLQPRPTKEQWVSWNTDTLGCPLAKVYNKKEAISLMDKFHNLKTWTTNWGWFRIIWGKK